MLGPCQPWSPVVPVVEVLVTMAPAWSTCRLQHLEPYSWTNLPHRNRSQLAFFAVVVVAAAAAAAVEALWQVAPVTKVGGPSLPEPDWLSLGPMCPVGSEKMIDVKILLELTAAGFPLAQLLNLLVNWW